MIMYKKTYIKKYIPLSNWDESLREKEKIFMKNGECISINTTFLQEAVIKVDDYICLFLNKLDKVYNKINDKDIKFKEIIEILNFEFNVYNLLFKYSFIAQYDPENSGINEMYTGVTKKAINKTTIICNQFIEFAFIKNYKVFRKKFEILIHHELIHRGQFINIKDNKLRYDIIKNEYESKSYYARKLEIMAYARTIIEELRFGGINDNDILYIIKNNKTGSSAILDGYIELFSKGGPKILHQLYKYVYEYLKG